jgi:hypothetical protein
MKHLLWGYGVDPLVIPNGIPRRWLEPVDDHTATTIRRSLGQGPALLKVARWNPDKRWLLALDTVAQLKALARPARLIARGGIEEHGGEVLAHARDLGLQVQDVAVHDEHFHGSLRAPICSGNLNDTVCVRPAPPPTSRGVVLRPPQRGGKMPDAE